MTKKWKREVVTSGKVIDRKSGKAYSIVQLFDIYNCNYVIREKSRLQFESYEPLKYNATPFMSTSYGEYFMVQQNENYCRRTIYEQLYCPICQRTYKFSAENFRIGERQGYNRKRSKFAVCKHCLRFYREKSGNRKIGIINLDPLFGLNLKVEELALAFQLISENKSMSKICESLEHLRAKKVGTYERISKKTVQYGCYRIAPLIKLYVKDCCRPMFVDRELIIDTFCFTRKSFDLTFDDTIEKELIQFYVTIIIGGYSTALYGFGVAEDEFDSALKCAKMAKIYTSGVLRECMIKFDDSHKIRKALVRAGVPESHLTSVSKSVCRSYINKVEGIIRILRAHGLKKRRYSTIPGVFTKLVIEFVNWNFFKKHTLFDSRWEGKIFQLLQINGPKNWKELIEDSWQYILSRGDLFKRYYPKFNRGPRKRKAHKTMLYVPNHTTLSMC